MKMTFILTYCSLLLISNANAADTNSAQTIDCHFRTSPDHVMISLKDGQNGTFVYSTGADDTISDSDTGKLPLVLNGDLKNDSSKKDYSQYSADWTTTQDNSSVTIQFLFSMPKSVILKNSAAFVAGFSTTITDSALAPLHGSEDLDCVARVNSPTPVPAPAPSKTTK